MNKEYMKRAIALSRKNIKEVKGGPFGAVIVKDGEIIAEGNNQVLHTNDPTNHAEIVAIRKACEKLNSYHLDDCEIYTSCEPCPMCLGAIYWTNIKTIYYAADRKDAAEGDFNDDFIYNELSMDPLTRSIPAKQCLKEEGSRVIQDWKKTNKDIIY